MAQADPSASTNTPPRRSTRQPKPVRRDPNFIYTDFQRHLASLDDESDFPASLFPESDVSGRKCTKKTTKRPTSKQSHQLLDPDFLYTDLESQLNDLRLSNLEQEASPSSHLQQAQQADNPPPSSNVPKTNLSPQASPERDLNHEIRLVQLQKEKLALELEVLRLRHAPRAALDGQADETPTSSATVDKTKKKRAIDWPHEFAPGNSTSVNVDYDKLELPQFVAGFLAMIKPYDTAQKSAMLNYLELLMLKASSYSWSSVRAFHSHIARQIELWRLEWTSSDEIRDKAVTFFKHSDLRSSQHNANASTVVFPHQVSSSHQRTPAKSEADKACRQWNYYGSCSCDKSNQEAFNVRHKCRVCTKDHPMLQCPKRRHPIPPPNSV